MYPGGKGACYQRIINLIPEHDTYIETHLGGGAVMKRKRPARLNIGIDLNPIVLSVTAQEISPGSPIISGDGRPSPEPAWWSPAACVASDSTRATPVISDDAAASPSPAISPATTMQDLDPTAGNGDGGHLFSEAAIGRFSDGAPSPATTMQDPDPTVGNGDSGHLFLCMDAARFLEQYPFSGREFVYADPPYLMATRRSRRPIYRCEYSEQDHVALLERLRALPCPAAISGYWSELYADMLTGWPTVSFSAQTRGGRPATEHLWMNYAAPDRLHDYRYLGDDFRERERIKRKKQRWVQKLERMDGLERKAILWAIQEAGLL